jgi:dienelactone hydrolase
VIVQHGLGGRPEALVGLEELPDQWIYDRVGERLAQQGYVVFAPFMNWGWGRTTDRDGLAKRSFALGIAPNRPEAAQLAAIVSFLSARPEVAPGRIGFYGLSYGGHAALWLTPDEVSLASVVVSGHFSQWQDKLFSTERAAALTYVCVDEGLDMFHFNILNELGHAELLTARLPRPTMVESGLNDPVIPPDWVKAEFAVAEARYEAAHARAKIRLQLFPGPHRIWSEASFRFLRETLYQDPERSL